MFGFGTFGLVILILEVVCLVHAIKNGRSFFWVYAIVFLPLAGTIAYFIVEVVPDIMHGPQMASAAASVSKLIDPTKDLVRLREQLAICDTVQTRQALADESMRCGLTDEAISLYSSCLYGIYKDDPQLLASLAQAYFRKQAYQEAGETLERLLSVDARYRPGETHLLLGRVREAQGNDQAALDEYTEAARSYLGEEARYRQAMLLKKLGREPEAREIFSQIITKWKRAPGHVRVAQKEWAMLAQDQLK